MERQLGVFDLANEDYGVDIADVEGIVKMQTITSVPHAPSFVAAPWVRGITNLRGEVLPVIDLRKWFGLPQGGGGADVPGRLDILLDLAKVLSTEEQTDLQAMQRTQVHDENDAWPGEA